MMEWYPWVVFAHVIGAFGFVLAHGVSAFVAFRVRRARSASEVSSLLELSGSSLSVAYASLLVILVSGIAAGFMGDWWGRPWIWISIGLLLAIATAMFLIGTRYYAQVRAAVAPRPGSGEPAVEGAELVRLLDSRRPHILALIGGGGLAAIVWLMMMKPL
jgi:uncharacterized membrane protein